jgi:hypothetical protein
MDPKMHRQPIYHIATCANRGCGITGSPDWEAKFQRNDEHCEVLTALWATGSGGNMTDKKTIEVFIAMNEDGDWIVEPDESDALSKLAEDVGGYHARVVKLTVKMAPPKMTEATVDVPDEAGQTLETKAA